MKFNLTNILCLKNTGCYSRVETFSYQTKQIIMMSLKVTSLFKSCRILINLFWIFTLIY